MTGIDPREALADQAAAARDFAKAEQLLAAIVADFPNRGEAWFKLATIRRAMGKLRGALDAVTGALRLDPLAFVPLLMKANLLDQLNDVDEAGEMYGAALFQAPAEDLLPPALREQLTKARERHAAYITRREMTYQHASARALDRANAIERKRIERFRTNALRKTRTWHQQPTHFHFPGLAEHEFFERDFFPFMDELEASADAIRAEFDALIASERGELVPYIREAEGLPSQMKSLNHSRDWTAIHLLAFGIRVEANAQHCPLTMSVFKRVDQPIIPGRSPNLMFSLLAPHTRIAPHTGVSNARLVIHLPLVIPPNCGFRVGAETRPWIPGEPFVFDDTIEHEAWNDSDQLRVILMGDIWRPELSAVEREAVTAMIAASSVPTDL